MTECQEILQRIGYPIDIVVLDFETRFTSTYHMGSSGLSTPEYVMDERFDFLGMAYDTLGVVLYTIPKELERLAPTIRRWCTDYTVVAHNAAFDGLILKEKFGVAPKYCIDTIGLSRFFEARARHKLEECAKRYGLQPKGELAFAKGKHWKDLTPPLRKQLISYAKNDVEITARLFEIMLPLLPRPKKELAIMQDLLERAWEPRLEFNFEKAEELKGSMEEQINKKLLEIDWL
jgi:DNA polymerase III epsilon subunit-like protein